MIPAIILTVLQLIDACTTHSVLKRGGIELNPILAWLFNQVGHVAGLIAIKGAFIAILWAALPTLDLAPPWLAAALLWTLVAVYVLIVFNNLRAMKRQRAIEKGAQWL